MTHLIAASRNSPGNDTFLSAADRIAELPEPAPDWALFLDIDGTLYDIAPTPDAVLLDPLVPHLLERLSKALGGAVAVVSGRSLADIDRLTWPRRLPAAGLHGGERRDAAGRLHIAPVDRQALAEIKRQLVNIFSGWRGLLVEDKGLAVAVHYRLAPDHQEAVRSLVRLAVAPHADIFALQEGKMVVEIKSRGVDKGKALRAFLGEEPFRGRRPVMVGDDQTDEYGFAVACGLGGIAIRVGRPTPATAAMYLIETVGALRHWLETIADRLGAEEG